VVNNMSPEDKARVLAEAKATLERTNPKRKPWRWGRPDPEQEAPPWPATPDEPLATVPRNSCAAQDRWRADAEQREAIAEAERRIERSREAEQRRDAQELAAQVAAQAEARLWAIAKAVIDEELAKLDQVVGDAIVDAVTELRNELRAEIDGLRVDRNFDRGLDQGGDVIDLPPFLKKRA
jgi:hypothetical protein